MSPYRSLAMVPTLLLSAVLAAHAAPPASSTVTAGPAAPSAAARRIAIPGPDGKPFPYTIEIPAGWEVIRGKDMPGVYLGPAGLTTPETDPRPIYVRISPASLANPEEVVANIKRSELADASWSAPLVEVREVGGVRGVLVRMDSGSGILAHSTLVLKLPLGQTSVDLMASAPRPEFERQLANYQRVMLSVQPVR